MEMVLIVACWASFGSEMSLRYSCCDCPCLPTFWMPGLAKVGLEGYLSFSVLKVTEIFPSRLGIIVISYRLNSML